MRGGFRVECVEGADVTEGQVRHQVQLFVCWLGVTFVVGLVVWAGALALGVSLHPLPVFAFAGVATWAADGILYRWRRS